MWKPSSSSSRLVAAFLKLHFNRHQVNPFGIPSSSSSANVFHQLPSNPSSSNAGLSQFQFRFTHHQSLATPLRNLYIAKPNPFSPSGLRFFSFKTSNSGTARLLVYISMPFSRGITWFCLVLEEFCSVLCSGGLCSVLLTLLLASLKEWQSMAFLPSTAIVSFAGLYIRSRLTINPDKVYRMAMRRLNTAAGILEVMGAPLTGTDLRAYVMSGGGLTLKKFKPKLRSKRCFLIFPIQGSERKGLVSVEVKKNKGEYDMKLLAVDIPMVSGPDQRLFLIGDEEEYKVGGGLISELRDPVVKAMAATKEFEDLDQMEEEDDAERELQEAERKHREEIEKLEKGGNQ
ncbi:hypothetical protein CRYUN_Cryun05aG0130700 [Craigia yunnanensis]